MNVSSMEAGRVSERPWRLYDVTVRYGDDAVYTETVAAPTPGKAKYRRFLDASDAISDLTFARFQRMCSARLAGGQPDPDAYAYIRRFYGLDFRHGDRVSIRREGADIEGRQATVVHPSGSNHYVHAVIDGEEHVSLFHPSSLVSLAPVRTPADQPVADDADDDCIPF